MTTTTAAIIGAGTDGLAMSGEVTAPGVHHQILQRGRLGEAWRRQRWDSLRLLTPEWAGGLPGLALRGPTPHGFMAMPEFAGCLEAFAEHMAAPVEPERDVQRLRPAGRADALATSRRPVRCRSLVLASGAFASGGQLARAIQPSGRRVTLASAHGEPGAGGPRGSV